MSDGDSKGFDMGEEFDKILANQETLELQPEQIIPADAALPADGATPADGTARDEQGRFAPKAPAERPADGAAVVDPAAAAVVEPVVPQAPDRLPKEIREEWGKLSEPVRAAIEKRERETHDIVTRVDRERQIGRGFDQTTAEYKDIIDQDGGGKPDVAVRNLLHTARMLRTGDPATKAQLVNQICTMYGIDIEQAYYSRPQPEIAQAQLAIQQRDAELAHYRQRDEAQQFGQVEQTIQQFAADKPDFYDVAPQMEILAKLGYSQDLSILYNAAKGAVGTLRSTSPAPAPDAAAAETAKQNAAAVAKARAAAVSPPSASGHAKPPGLATLDPLEAMSLEYDAIIARNSG
ncbi:hypothetical protein [Novosphingobium sp.]|uniref:hypothetical protein n=1 Tax=Novosphingobium sp. TaxID=1874826 RepID=UPI003D0BF1DE